MTGRQRIRNSYNGGYGVKGMLKDRYQFVINGEPVSGKNSQRILKNRKTGGRFIAKSHAAASWIVRAVDQLTQQRLAARYPTIRIDVRILCDIFQPSTTPDLDNSLNLVSDALQEAGVIANDSQVVEWNARKFVNGDMPRVELTVLPLNPSKDRGVA